MIFLNFTKNRSVTLTIILEANDKQHENERQPNLQLSQSPKIHDRFHESWWAFPKLVNSVIFVPIHKNLNNNSNIYIALCHCRLK